MNSDSFAPIDHWALPRARVLEQCETLRALMRARGVPGAILDADHELESELARTDVFGEPA